MASPQAEPKGWGWGWDFKRPGAYPLLIRVHSPTSWIEYGVHIELYFPNVYKYIVLKVNRERHGIMGGARDSSSRVPRLIPTATDFCLLCNHCCDQVVWNIVQIKGPLT